ncbi:uncharacterized protein BXIN_0907 [Babesia sp. Xinjiang]|uniref:uncharacterized protein n=1 Tax=Babesia sp. Xinjiang TaxID=462227 RepID=UPI000A2161F2|nr:uncharacterized protein BXIN_0907 [Babesia sp. Xinjiang]ORM42052.1 hypothetical protein BXIN_0907 [Babesia sp. Xinjiang]
MNPVSQEEAPHEHQKETWVSSAPKSAQLVKPCCTPRDGAIPITIPVYSPVYHGTQVLSGTPGIIPQQQHVFASPFGTNQQLCQGVQVMQKEPLYQIQSKLFNDQPHGFVADQPVNVTHYVWKQTSEQPTQPQQSAQPEPLKHQGTFAKLRTLFNWQDSNASEEYVQKLEDANDTTVHVTGHQTEQGNVEPIQKTKRQPICGVFNSCCMNTGEVPGYENASGTISHANTLVRESSLVSGMSNATHIVMPSRGGSIQSNVSVPIGSQKNDSPRANVVSNAGMVSQGSINATHRITPQESINSQRVVVPQASMCVQHGLVPQEGIITHNGMVPQGSIVHQTSIPTHAANSVCQVNNLQNNETVNTGAPLCFSMCYPRTISNHAETVVPMTSIQSQASIPVGSSDVSCFGSCFGQNSANGLTSYATQGSFGLRNMFTMNPLFAQRAMSTAAVPVDGISRQVSTISLQPIHDATGGVHTASSQLLSQPLLIQEPTVYETQNPVQKKCAMKPKTFKLHAVEIHQFVPMPTTPTSKFVQSVSGMNQMGTPVFQHGLGIQHPNCFFNPNTTGHVAPVMRDVMEGVANPKIPHMYSMDSERSHQVVRLQTDESKITPREDADAVSEQHKEHVVEPQGEQN